MSHDKFASYSARENDRRRRLKKIIDNAAANRRLANAIKLESGCVDCGYKADARALQFDHRDETKKRDCVSQIVKKSTRVMLAEIAKCVVRCANCHLIRTHESGHHLGVAPKTNGKRVAVTLRGLFDVVPS